MFYIEGTRVSSSSGQKPLSTDQLNKQQNPLSTDQLIEWSSDRFFNQVVVGPCTVELELPINVCSNNLPLDTEN